jgi:hypothetical protein
MFTNVTDVLFWQTSGENSKENAISNEKSSLRGQTKQVPHSNIKTMLICFSSKKLSITNLLFENI